MSVRAATPADVPRMVELGAMLHAESPRYSQATYDPGKLTALGLRMTKGTLVTPAPGGAFVYETDGKIVGMLAAYVVEMFFGPDKVASDYTFYVLPEYRGTKAAWALWKAFEQWGRDQGAKFYVPGISTGIDPEMSARFYEKQGYERSGFTFFKKVM